MFKYFTEFYKQGVYHFLVSAVCAALFALGLEYSQGSNGDSGLPYFVPAMVLSALHFVMTIIALLACYYARSLSEIYDTLRKWDNSEKHFRRLKALYLLLQYPGFLWGIVGAALTGNSGICSNDENPCYYTVNDGKNRAIAIVIIVVHVLNVIISFITISTTHKVRREKNVDLTSLRKRSKIPEATTLSLKPPNFNARNNNKIADQKKDGGNIPQAKKEPQPLKRHISSISNATKLHKEDTNRQDILPPLKRHVKRHHTMHEGMITSADNTSLKPRGTIQNETIQSNKNDKKIRRLISKVSVVAPKNRNASFVTPKNKALYNESDDSSTSSDDSNMKKSKKNKKHAIPKRRMSERPKVPPPTYNQVIESHGTEPYWLPPLPRNDSSLHYLPENMYTGYSYPDTELVPAQPIEVPKAQWQIR